MPNITLPGNYARGPQNVDLPIKETRNRQKWTGCSTSLTRSFVTGQIRRGSTVGDLPVEETRTRLECVECFITECYITDLKSHGSANSRPSRRGHPGAAGGCRVLLFACRTYLIGQIRPGPQKVEHPGAETHPGAVFACRIFVFRPYTSGARAWSTFR